MSAVIVGPLDTHDRELLSLAARRANVAAEFIERAADAPLALRGAQPRCIVVDASGTDVAAFVDWVRSQARLFSVPVVVMVPVPNDAAFNEAHAMGADDVLVMGDGGGITRRLANLGAFDPNRRPPITQGRAVLGYPAGGRRRVLGRVLRQAGFDVAFAASAQECGAVADHGDHPALLVAKGDLPGGAFDAFDRVRRQSRDTPMVALAANPDLQGMRQRAARLGHAAVGSEYAPPDHLLFLANELMRPGVDDIRASERVLFGAICAFRPAGDFDAVYGLTYNISREGLYIRTLDPPVRGTSVWFEIRPPHEGRAVHLRGEVMWRKGLTGGGGAAPPGFGMRIDEEACPPEDLADYRAAYEALHQSPILYN